MLAAECRILPTAKHHIGRTQKPRCRQRQRGFKTKKGTNTTANPSYVLKKISLPHLLCILYQIFRQAQIFVGFFRGRLPAADIQRPAAVAYLSAGLRNLEFCQQLFVQSRLYTGERSLLPATVLPSGLTGPHSPARIIFFTGQILDFRLRTTFLPRRLRRRQPRFRSHKQINKRISKKIPKKPKKSPKKIFKRTTKRTSLPRKRKSLLFVSETKKASPALAGLARLFKRFKKV